MTFADRLSPSRDVASHCLSGRRLLISEEALKDEVGHWFEYCRAVQDIHTSRDADVVTLAHVNVTGAVREALNAVPLFRETSWDGMHVEPNLIRRYWGVITHNWLVFRSVDRFLRVQGPFDIAFVPTVTIYHLIGWRLVAALHGGRRIGRIVLLVPQQCRILCRVGRSPSISKTVAHPRRFDQVVQIGYRVKKSASRYR